MSPAHRFAILLASLLGLAVASAHAQARAGVAAPADRAVYLDKQGVVRWRHRRAPRYLSVCHDMLRFCAVSAR